MARPQDTADGAQIRRKALVINYLVWAVAVIVMVVSATTTANLMVQHHNSYAQGLALGLAVDASIAVSLIGDQLLQQSGRRSGWGTALRWITAMMSLLLNCAQSFQDGDALGVALHAIPVVLLTSLTEAAQDYQLMLGRNSSQPDPAGLQTHGSHGSEPVADDVHSLTSFGGQGACPVTANASTGTDLEYSNREGTRPSMVSTALAEMLTERGPDPSELWTPKLWDQAVDCAVRYREDTGRPVRVDDIQELGIGRNRALRLRQDVLAHLERAAAHAGTESPPSTDDLVLAPLELVIRHRDDTLARLRVTPDPDDTETLRRHLIAAIDDNVDIDTHPVRIEDYALDIHRADQTSLALLSFTASGAR
ncbi:hypothetical protein [Umezawaea sp. Da 62-37]|uniref:hypothetical protein n=1 Tax=Umezawaea sp. Da 62-37 TaxID=3075927 RepID=UPI0028F7361D|nr:hypothetical protein [Umezawaea sp. Da 62-37]WNV82900.1 hypothetical protein RM788_32500 [Umezawaea sp. Da 62-37]